MKNLDKRQSLLLFYKLLHDFTFILFIVFAILLMTEAILPEFLAFHLDISLFVLLILVVVGSIGQLSRKLEIDYLVVSIRKNKFVPLFVIMIILLLGNSMLKFSLWENLLIICGTLSVLFFFYRIILRAEH